ncbi:MAG: DUF3332 domain-containing protein [Muribaculaceae bacterium]|nr:DUF3332 domain-containing protein [Muribaculaceae bacterium]
MKKKIVRVASILAMAALLLGQSSCIGSFSLTNKLLAWNRNIDTKFVNELVFFAFWIVPVYEVSALADILVLNSIEFWSGNNPVASGTRTIKGEDGQKYLVEADENGYTITGESDKQVVRLDFDKETRSWEYTVNEGETRTLMTFVDDTHVSMPTPDGQSMVVELSKAGVMAYQQAVCPAMAFNK